MPTVPRQRTVTPVLVVIAIGLCMPMLLTGGYQLRLAMLAGIFAILGMGFNLVYGFTGQISLGQQGFFAIGAYAFAMLETKLGWPPVLAVPVGLMLCATVALLLGLPLLRLRTHYLAMATLSFGLIFAGIANRWIDFTGGTTGIEIPPLSLGDYRLGRIETYYVIMFFTAAVLLVHDFVVRSHIGRALQGIRDDERAASALGVHVTRYKLRIFVLAATISGAAGICFAIANLRVDPSMSEFHILVTLLTAAVIGGLGTRFGAILGAIVVVILPQYLTRFGEMETLVYGGCILLFLLFLPHGLAGPLESLTWLRLFGQKPKSGVSAPAPAPARSER